MPELRYCWRCDVVVPMLDDEEWSRVEPLLNNALDDVKTFRREKGASLKEAMQLAHGARALELYHHITGFRETNANALWHHRLSLLGAPCATCGKPLRTPRAKLCAACGAVAGAGVDASKASAP